MYLRHAIDNAGKHPSFFIVIELSRTLKSVLMSFVIPGDRDVYSLLTRQRKSGRITFEISINSF